MGEKGRGGIGGERLVQELGKEGWYKNWERRDFYKSWVEKAGTGAG